MPRMFERFDLFIVFLLKPFKCVRVAFSMENKNRIDTTFSCGVFKNLGLSSSCVHYAGNVKQSTNTISLISIFLIDCEATSW